AVVVHNFCDDCQAQADSFLLRCEKWIEDLLAQVRRDSGAGIFELDGDAGVASRSFLRDGDAQFSLLAVQGLEGVEDKIYENLFAELAIGANLRKIASVAALNMNLGGGHLCADGIERAIHDCGNLQRLQIEMRGTGKIEKARDERIQAVHFGGNVASEFAGERIRAGYFLREHFGGDADDAERVADFMSQPGGQLTESGEALGAARFGFGAAQLAVGFFESFRERLKADELATIFNGETVDKNRSNKKEQDANGEVGGSFGGQFIFLESRDEQGTVAERGESGPEKRGKGPEVNCSGDYGQIKDRVVAAVDSDFAGVSKQESGKQNFYDDAINAAASRQPGDEAAFEQLKYADGEEDQLLVDFFEGREHSEAGEKGQPEKINPADG